MNVSYIKNRNTLFRMVDKTKLARQSGQTVSVNRISSFLSCIFFLKSRAREEEILFDFPRMFLVKLNKKQCGEVLFFAI